MRKVFDKALIMNDQNEKLKKNKIVELQNEMDLVFNDYLMEEFQLKRKYEILTEKFSKEIDRLFLELSDDSQKTIMSSLFSMFPEIHYSFPVELVNDKEYFDGEFVKFVKVQYLDNLKAHVTLWLFDNQYIHNNKLDRIISFDGKNDVPDVVHYRKGAQSCELFDFFSEEDVDLGIFDILSDIYRCIGAAISERE